MARTRGVHKAPSNEVASLQSLVDRLIKENRNLKRQIAKLAEKSPIELRPLSALVRKVERAVSDSKSTGDGRTRRAAAPRPRKPASPETQEKRRQALTRARAARAAKLNAQSKLIKVEETPGGHVEK